MHNRLPLLLLIGLLALPGCQRKPMSLPEMFAAGQVAPLADVPPNAQSHQRTLFFATDRVAEHRNDTLRYTRKRNENLAVGTLTLSFGKEGDWDKIVAATRAQPGGKRISPSLGPITPLGELIDPPFRQFSDTQAAAKPDEPQPVAKRFLQELNDAVDRSAGKAITIYIHGFKNSFEEAAEDTAEYDLYTGGLGPFIVYSWPSYDSVFQYSHDRDSVRYTTAHARNLTELLANAINNGSLDADKIHFIAHSSGAEVVGSVLRELALISRDTPPDQRRQRWRIGSILFIAPDISTDVARERVLKEDLRGICERIVVYSSPRDTALQWASSVIYRTPRIGSVREDQFTPNDRDWLSKARNVQIIDIEKRHYIGIVNHAHHRWSAAVASDLILCLRSDLSPEERGLERKEGEILWHFADDYAQRVTEAAIRVYGKAQADD